MAEGIEAMKAGAAGVEIDAIARLEDKVRKLVEQARTEQARLTTENKALGDEVSTLRKKLVDSESTVAELATLRDEREQVRTRVADMLAQIEALGM
jgi:peptidoglycan hydrolase CwlO-like protein